MSLLSACLLVQSAMLGFKVSVTHALTVSINLCKEWANLEHRGIAFTEVKIQKILKLVTRNNMFQSRKLR